jgi:hypothetical protein
MARKCQANPVLRRGLRKSGEHSTESTGFDGAANTARPAIFTFPSRDQLGAAFRAGAGLATRYRQPSRCYQREHDRTASDGRALPLPALVRILPAPSPRPANRGLGSKGHANALRDFCSDGAGHFSDSPQQAAALTRERSSLLINS